MAPIKLFFVENLRMRQTNARNGLQNLAMIMPARSPKLCALFVGIDTAAGSGSAAKRSKIWLNVREYGNRNLGPRSPLTLGSLQLFRPSITRPRLYAPGPQNRVAFLTALIREGPP